jgi:hypothetical protein
MRLDRVQPGDVIKAAIKSRTGIWGDVTEVKDGTVYFQRSVRPAAGGTPVPTRWLATGARRAAAGLQATRTRRRSRSNSSHSQASIPRPARSSGKEPHRVEPQTRHEACPLDSRPEGQLRQRPRHVRRATIVMSPTRSRAPARSNDPSNHAGPKARCSDCARSSRREGRGTDAGAQAVSGDAELPETVQ